MLHAGKLRATQKPSKLSTNVTRMAKNPDWWLTDDQRMECEESGKCHRKTGARPPQSSGRAPIMQAFLQRTQEIQEVLLLLIAERVKLRYHDVGLRAGASVVLDRAQ